jgi:hypothetical protein
MASRDVLVVLFEVLNIDGEMTASMSSTLIFSFRLLVVKTKAAARIGLRNRPDRKCSDPS